MRRRLLGFVIAGTIAATAGASSATTAGSADQPAWSADGQWLAYSARGEGDHVSDVFVENVNGSGRSNLTGASTASAYGDPTWSPGGQRLAFVVTLRPGLQDALFGYIVANADGSAPMQVGTSPTEGKPSFSPDGRYLAFAGSDGIEVARTDGSGQQQIAASGGYPLFSPRRDRVAFTLVDRTDQGHIYTATSAGSARRRLTARRGFDYPLAWSHGGGLLLFHTDREAFKALSPRTDAVYAMHADGTEQHRVAYGREADFSPGAARVVFTDAGGGLWTARLDGSGHHRLVAGPAEDPRWSPDGRWIAYTFTVDDTSRIELIHPDGSGRHVFAP